MHALVRTFLEDNLSPAADSELPDFVVAGPTASGKSAFAARLAERTGSEVVGCDAFQVYRGVPVLTAQPSEAEMAAVRHHLVGVLSVSEIPDAVWYAREARRAIRSIHATHRRVILVGGTGFYLRSLLEGLSPDTPTGDDALRAVLEQMPLEELVAEVRAKDAEAASTMDLKNPRRVVRAVEVMRLSGRPFSSFRVDRVAHGVPGIRLGWDRSALWSRIERRTDAMLVGGALDEVARARESVRDGVGVCLAIGFREVEECLDGKRTLPETRDAIVIGTRQYAKRQTTWFRGQTAFDEVCGKSAEEWV